ncbi:alkaline phosphatase [Vibrio sp. JCM 18904]|nr:alkaline phosphatase [Vibrio sp. JCM 18904]
MLTEAQDQGYNLAFSRDMLTQAKGDKLLGLFAYSGMNDGIATVKAKTIQNARSHR